jgi:transcription initiation factor TFIID subunit 11
MAIKSIAKVYAGDMIEGARKVQAQWNYSDEELKEAIKKKMEEMSTPPTDIPAELINEVKRLPAGPLLPEHLREAHRRYKAGREGGSVGQMGLQQVQLHSGLSRFATKTGGKRLFK